MAKTLVLYDGRSSSAERVAVTLGCIIGRVRIRELGDAPETLEGFQNVLFVCNFYGALTASRTRDYVAARREALSACRIALVGVGFSDVGFVKYVGSLESMLHLSEPLATVFLRNEKMTVEVGAHLSRIFGKSARPIRANALLESIEAFASAHSVMALATANEDYVRCTPVDYSYADGKFYIVTEGGMKFRSILRNNHVSLAVFENERHPDGLLDVLQVEGTVEVLPGDSPVAHREAAARIARGGMNSGEIFVLCVTPQRYRISSAAFAAAGFDAEQSLEPEDLEALRGKEAAPASANAAPAENADEGAAKANAGDPAAEGLIDTVGDADFTDSLEQAEAYADVSRTDALRNDIEPPAVSEDEEADEAYEEDPGTLADAEEAFALEASEEEKEDEPKEEDAAPDLTLGEGVDWLNFSVDFDVTKEKKTAGEGTDREESADAAGDGAKEKADSFDESIRPADEREDAKEPSASADTGESEEAPAGDDEEDTLPKMTKEPFADAEALAARESDADEAELFGEEDDEEKEKKPGFFASAKERFRKFRKKKAEAREDADEASEELPKTILSAQRKLSRKDETGPSRYVYNADEDDDLFDDYEDYDEFDKFD